MRRLWVLLGLLACTANVARAATSTDTPPQFTPVAHSALVTLDAAATTPGMRLRVRRTEGTAPLAVTELHVSAHGQSIPATLQADGTWLAPWPSSAGNAGGGRAAGSPDTGLEVVVVHDGIREVLNGPLPTPPAPASGATGGSSGLTSGRKQMAWWILNIAIIVIAVLAISRRMS